MHSAASIEEFREADWNQSGGFRVKLKNSISELLFRCFEKPSVRHPVDIEDREPRRIIRSTAERYRLSIRPRKRRIPAVRATDLLIERPRRAYLSIRDTIFTERGSAGPIIAADACRVQRPWINSENTGIPFSPEHRAEWIIIVQLQLGVAGRHFVIAVKLN